MAYGMTEDEISILEDEELERFNRRRNETRHGFESVPLYYIDEEGEEAELDHPALSYTEDICEDDPFQYGFNDDRLNKIVQNADETDLKILRLISEGLTMREIGPFIGISHVAVSKRVRKMLKFAN